MTETSVDAADHGAPHSDHAEEGMPHPYHIVRPSPWPLIGALSAGLFTFGIVLNMHDGIRWVMIVGLLGVLGTMIGWWHDVMFESVKEKAHSVVTKIGLRYGMLLFISSEVMFFVAFFWAYFDSAFWPDAANEPLRAEYTGGVWPPEHIITFDPLSLPFMMTLVLLLSGCTVTFAHHALQAGHRVEAARSLALTVLLGVIFSCLRPTNTAMPLLTSPAGPIPRPSTWRPVSTVFT